MADSRSYRAHVARGRCERGDFVLLGHRLVPLSLSHFLLLDQLLGDALYDTEPVLTVLEVLADVCSSKVPTGQVPARSEVELARAELRLSLDFNLSQERETWWGYLDACFLSRPFTRRPDQAGPAEYRAPWPLSVAAFLLQHTGISHERIWQELPVSEALWLYEAVAERVHGVTGFAATDEPPAPLSPEEQAAEEIHRRRAGEILSRCMAARSAAMRLPRKERKKRLAEIAVEQAEALRAARGQKSEV